MKRMKRMTKNEATKYLEKKYPEAHIFDGAIDGGMHDVIVAQEFDSGIFLDLEVVVLIN